MSTTIVAVLVNLLAVLLPYIGVDFDSEKVNNAIQTIVALVTGIYIWYRRTKMVVVAKGQGDVSGLGIKKPTN